MLKARLSQGPWSIRTHGCQGKNVRKILEPRCRNPMKEPSPDVSSNGTFTSVALPTKQTNKQTIQPTKQTIQPTNQSTNQPLELSTTPICSRDQDHLRFQKQKKHGLLLLKTSYVLQTQTPPTRLQTASGTPPLECSRNPSCKPDPSIDVSSCKCPRNKMDQNWHISIDSPQAMTYTFSSFPKYRFTTSASSSCNRDFNFHDSQLCHFTRWKSPSPAVKRSMSRNITSVVPSKKSWWLNRQSLLSEVLWKVPKYIDLPKKNCVHL